MSFARRSLVASLVSLAVAGCSGSPSVGDGVVDVGVSSGSSALTATASDAAAAGSGNATTPDAGSSATAATHLRVTVVEVDVHVAVDGASSGGSGNAGAHGGAADDGADSGGWSVVFTGSRQLDLLHGEGIESLLGGQSVPAGTVTQVRLILADDAVLVDNGTETPLDCASCTRTGLKLVTDGTVKVAAGDHLHLTLAIDPAESVVIEGNAAHLRPVVRLAGARHE